MAAFSHSRAGSRTSATAAEQELPNGSCNFRDPSLGLRATTCGCTRFWLNGGHYAANGDVTERAWCFCGHHACFHTTFTQQTQEREAATVNSRQETSVAGIGASHRTTNPSPQQYATPSKPPAGLGIHSGSRSQSQSINTRVFHALNAFAREQEDGEKAPSLHGGSTLPSTAPPSVAEELSSNEHSLQRLAQFRSMAPPVSIPREQAPRQAEDLSATEVATPSIAGTPDFRAFASLSNVAGPAPGHLQPDRPIARQSQPEMNQRATASPVQSANRVESLPAVDGVHMSASEMQSIIRMYGRRLEVLENLSFSQVPVEELQDRFEHFDGRILDLEDWRDDQEQARSTPEPESPTSSKRRRLLPAETSSFGSDASFDSNAAMQTEAVVLATLAANAETHPRIDALENRVQDLESAAMPSFARPWHVQVVLLPWSRELKGIWYSALDATQHSTRSTTQQSEEWTGATSGRQLPFKSAANAWTTESIEAWASETQEWLSPKACGPTGAVFQRLASRGLVRNITLTAQDARHISDTIDASFSDAADHIAGDTEAAQWPETYQGLRERFIPLRKVRKSARLRFLSQAEMISSARWDASFLDSSVFMKVNDGQRRLYITTPDAYLQSNTPSCSWKSIRELPPMDISREELDVRANNVAIEACWTYNDRLDQLVSLHSSFASHASRWSTQSQVGADNVDSQDAQPLSPQSQFRPQRQRTVSLPGSVDPVHTKDSLPKRRFASFEPVGSATSQLSDLGAEVVSKRRRISMSPEAERRGMAFTPRWSREPPSPYASEFAMESASQAASGSRKRGNTPFAYATPHSNTNHAGRVSTDSCDGDTEMATGLLVDRSERGEEEWEGVADGESGDDGIADDQDVDEDDLEDGHTIYEG